MSLVQNINDMNVITGMCKPIPARLLCACVSILTSLSVRVPDGMLADLWVHCHRKWSPSIVSFLCETNVFVSRTRHQKSSKVQIREAASCAGGYLLILFRAVSEVDANKGDFIAETN